jgi:hypothetical protein
MMGINFCKQPGMVIFKSAKLFWNIFDVNFQAGVNAHSEIPIEWQGHFLENALPAFHDGRTSLHMAASNGQVDIVCYMQPRTFKKSECEHCGQIWSHSLALGCPHTMSWQLQQGDHQDAKDDQC